MDERTPRDETIDAQDMLAATLHIPKHVVHRSFESEMVLLNLRTGEYHGVNRSGARMLELLEEADGNVREAIQRLAEEYDEDATSIEAGLASFCAALAARGLVEVNDGGA